MSLLYTFVHCKLTQVTEHQNTMHRIRLVLWLKALNIFNTKSFDVVLILSGFHTMMIFVGSTGALMNGSGLSECLETEFITNTVPKIMDGKAISRAIRAHFLTDRSFMAKLFAAFVSATNVEVEGAEAYEAEEAEENGEMNDRNPDFVNEGITNENEEWEEESSHTEISESMNVTSVFEDAGIQQLSKEEKSETVVMYQKIQENYEEGTELLQTSLMFQFVCSSLETL